MTYSQDNARPWRQQGNFRTRQQFPVMIRIIKCDTQKLTVGGDYLALKGYTIDPDTGYTKACVFRLARPGYSFCYESSHIRRIEQDLFYEHVYKAETVSGVIIFRVLQPGPDGFR